jgi:hypothetical protein
MADHQSVRFSPLLDYLIPLVEHAQPSWMVYRTARLLTFAASRMCVLFHVSRVTEDSLLRTEPCEAVVRPFDCISG